MNITPLTPLGAQLDELALGALRPAAVTRLRDLLAEHGVLVIPGQHALDDDGFLAFLRSLGTLAFTRGETPLPGYPDLNAVSNVGRSEPPRSHWHIDTGYVAEPPVYTALRVVEVPAEGGGTLFADGYAAARELDPAVADDLRGRRITHIATGVSLEDGDEAAAEHPVLRRHPVSGREVLYLDSPARCAAVSGLSPEAGRALVAELLEHCTRPEHVLVHRWAPGDVVIWDNGCVLHRADHSEVRGDRVLHRGMVAAYPEAVHVGDA